MAVLSVRNEKDLSRTRGQRAGGSDALGDDDGEMLHLPIVPRAAVGRHRSHDPGLPGGGAQCTPASETSPRTSAATTTSVTATSHVRGLWLSGSTMRDNGRRTR